MHGWRCMFDGFDKLQMDLKGGKAVMYNGLNKCQNILFSLLKYSVPKKEERKEERWNEKKKEMKKERKGMACFL